MGPEARRDGVGEKEDSAEGVAYKDRRRRAAVPRRDLRESSRSEVIHRAEEEDQQQHQALAELAGQVLGDERQGGGDREDAREGGVDADEEQTADAEAGDQPPVQRRLPQHQQGRGDVVRQ